MIASLDLQVLQNDADNPLHEPGAGDANQPGEDSRLGIPGSSCQLVQFLVENSHFQLLLSLRAGCLAAICPQKVLQRRL